MLFFIMLSLIIGGKLSRCILANCAFINRRLAPTVSTICTTTQQHNWQTTKLASSGIAISNMDGNIIFNSDQHSDSNFMEWEQSLISSWFCSDSHFQRYGGGGVTHNNTEEQLLVLRLRFSKMWDGGVFKLRISRFPQEGIKKQMAPVQVSSNWWRFSPPYHRLSHDSVIPGENCDEARMSEREMRALQEKVVVCLCSSSMVQNEGIIDQKILFDSNQQKSGSALFRNWPDHVFVEKGPTFTYSHQDKDSEPSWNDLRIREALKKTVFFRHNS